MSLVVFKDYLEFAEGAVDAKADLSAAIDAPEFESALVSYGVVLLHSHMEQCLRSALDARCARCSDPEIRAFSLKVRDEKAGRIGIASLKDTLGRFCDAYKRAFKAHIDDSGFGDPPPSWDSVVNQRKTVAHGGKPATCSLADLRLFYEDVRRILGFFCDALGLDAAEVAPISSLIVLPAQQAATGEPPPVAS